MAVQHVGLAWKRDLETDLQKARAEKQHVLLDFSAAPM